MTLTKLSEKQHSKAVKLLADYWQNRGMSQYDSKWARQYLVEGHKKEIKKDDFYAHLDNGELIGLISLVTNVSDVAEIRDEVVSPDFEEALVLKEMLKEIEKVAKSQSIRKIYSLVLKKNISVYNFSGFTKEGVLKNHFVDGEDLTIMSKFLQ